NAMATKLFDTDRANLLNTPFGFPVVVGDTTEIDLRSEEGPRCAEMRVVQSEWEGATAYIASLRAVTERRRAEQNERELIREQAARTAAEEAARRLRFLLASSTALAGSLDYDATLSALARVCVPELADLAHVYSVDRDGHSRPSVRRACARLGTAGAAIRRRGFGSCRGCRAARDAGPGECAPLRGITAGQ